MMRHVSPVLLGLLAAFQLAAPARAQDSDKVKAFTNEKALLDAQAARDVAEASAIKAATDLAKAKSSAADADRAALEAKAVRDQAETAAITAAKALADAKAAAGNVASQATKSQLDADAALTTAKVTAETAEISALKAAFGAAPSIGSDGNVAITESTGGMLLESKSGSLKATGALAEKLCSELKEHGVQGAFIAPPDLERKMLASKFVLREFRDLSRQANSQENLDLVGGSVTAQISPAALLSAVSLLQYGAGALQSVAKLFRSDYSVAVADGKRETWFEYFMAASCPKQLPRANVEATVRARGFDVELKQLNQLAEFVDSAASQKVSQTRKLEAANAAIKEKKDAKLNPLAGDVQDAADAQKSLTQLAKLDGLLARMKAVVDLVATKPDAFLEAVVWDYFASDEYRQKPRIALTFTTQDGQVMKSHWLTGKHIYGRSSGELIYRVMTADGTVSLAGYLVATNSDGALNFSANANPVADGRQYTSAPPASQTTEAAK